MSQDFYELRPVEDYHEDTGSVLWAGLGFVANV